jgi:hypothetical protein
VLQESFRGGRIVRGHRIMAFSMLMFVGYLGVIALLIMLVAFYVSLSRSP